jgi:hypothetical protein
MFQLTYIFIGMDRAILSRNAKITTLTLAIWPITSLEKMRLYLSLRNAKPTVVLDLEHTGVMFSI